jgi:signal peptidase II
VAIIPENSVARSPLMRWAMLAISATVLAADQVSKTLVLALHHPVAGTGWVTVRLVRNTGANGGIAAGYPVLVTLTAIVIAGLAAAFALRARGRGAALCLAAVLGGALGNLSDRLFRAPGFGRGAVVDWIHISPLSGSLNVSDVAIEFGVLGVVLVLLFSERSSETSGAPEASQAP